MLKDQDSKGASAPQSEEAEKRPGKRRATKEVELVQVKVIETHGQSALVQYRREEVLHRSFVDPKDIDEGMCSLERLQDAPCGIQWKFDFTGLARTLEIELKKRAIWTYDDLIETAQKIPSVTSRALAPIIWAAAKREQ